MCDQEEKFDPRKEVKNLVRLSLQAKNIFSFRFVLFHQTIIFDIQYTHTLLTTVQ